jgi:hypothetical protein
MFPLKGRKDDRRYPMCKDCYPEYVKRRQAQSRAQNERFKQRRKHGLPTEREMVPQLPTEPIRRWLIDELGVPSIEESARLSIQEMGQVEEVAQWLNVGPRQIHRWRSGETDRTSLDDFDKALCHAGVPWKLRELFPALYKPSRTAHLKYRASCLECHGPCLGYDPSAFDWDEAEGQVAA